MNLIGKLGAVLAVLGWALIFASGASAAPEPAAHDLVVRNFHFRSGETLAELKIHYYTLGTPQRDD